MNGQWLAQQTAANTAHTVPLDDHIVHEFTDGCPCGPETLDATIDGPQAWIVVHHSLDGREKTEPDRRGDR